MNKRVFAGLAVSFFSLTVSPKLYADDFQEDLFGQSIEELLQVESDIAGFTSESIANSPSVVTIFTERDIQTYGLDNVYDIMNFVPGFQTVIGEKVGSQSKMQARGVYLDNGYVLVMIDGVRTNEVSFGKASVYTPFIDIKNIQKIEIIRGPGSSVYGSNAFLGVINVVTKKDNHLSVSLGSGNAKRFSFGLTSEIKNGEFALQFSNYQGDGGDYELFNYKSNQLEDTTRPFDHQQLAVSWTSKKIDLGYRSDAHELNGFINLNGFHSDNYYLSENKYWFAKFNHDFTPKTRLNMQLDTAQHEIESAGFILDSDIQPFSHDALEGPNWATERQTLQASVSHQFNMAFHLNFGVELQKEEQTRAGVVSTHITDNGQSTSPYVDNHYQGGLVIFDELGDFSALKQSVTSRAWFTELQWQIDAKQKIYFGGRHEYYDIAGKAFSPRLSYVFNYNNNNKFKAIYSKAFRAPVTNELYSNDGVTQGNKELKPELVETGELQWLYNKSNLALETTFFYTEMTDMIASKPLQDGRFSFFNDNSDRVTGAEFIGHYEINGNWATRVTYTEIFKETVCAQLNNYGTASLFFNYGKWSSNLHFIIRPKSRVKNKDGEEIYRAQEHNIINWATNYQYGKNFKLELAITNLNDLDYRAFEPRQSLNDFAVKQPPRSIRLTAEYKF